MCGCMFMGAEIFFLMLEGARSTDSASLGWEWSSTPLAEGSAEKLFAMVRPLVDCVSARVWCVWVCVWVCVCVCVCNTY